MSLEEVRLKQQQEMMQAKRKQKQVGQLRGLMGSFFLFRGHTKQLPHHTWDYKPHSLIHLIHMKEKSPNELLLPGVYPDKR